MKPTQEQVIAWARDSGMELYGLGTDRAKFVYYLEAFAALAYEAGRKDGREWQDLTDDESDEIWGECLGVFDCLKMTQAKLKEKNT